MARLTNELPRDLAPTAEGEDTIEERVAVIAGWVGASCCVTRTPLLLAVVLFVRMSVIISDIISLNPFRSSISVLMILSVCCCAVACFCITSLNCLIVSFNSLISRKYWVSLKLGVNCCCC